ncbi:MAG: hypothetical protein ACYTFT_06520, partial [Planctomycetota bacterium]
ELASADGTPSGKEFPYGDVEALRARFVEETKRLKAAGRVAQAWEPHREIMDPDRREEAVAAADEAWKRARSDRAATFQAAAARRDQELKEKDPRAWAFKQARKRLTDGGLLAIEKLPTTNVDRLLALLEKATLTPAGRIVQGKQREHPLLPLSSVPSWMAVWAGNWAPPNRLYPRPKDDALVPVMLDYDWYVKQWPCRKCDGDGLVVGYQDFEHETDYGTMVVVRHGTRTFDVPCPVCSGHCVNLGWPY